MEEFVIGFKANREFDAKVAASFVFEGIGAAAVLGAWYYHYTPGILTGLGIVLLGIVSLLFHLGHIFRFWRVMARLKSAWISRGAFVVGGLLVFGALSILWPESGAPAQAIIVGAGTVVFGLMTMLYSGFLLSSMRSTPFWNSPFLPVVFLSHSAASGLAVLLFLFQLNNPGAVTGRLLEIELGLLVLALIFTVMYLLGMGKSSPAARESVRILVQGESRLLFYGGAVFLGLIIPLIITGIIYWYPDSSGTITLAGLIAVLAARFLGDFLYKLAVINSGVYEAMI